MHTILAETFNEPQKVLHIFTREAHSFVTAPINVPRILSEEVVFSATIVSLTYYDFASNFLVCEEMHKFPKLIK